MKRSRHKVSTLSSVHYIYHLIHRIRQYVKVYFMFFLFIFVFFKYFVSVAIFLNLTLTLSECTLIITNLFSNCDFTVFFLNAAVHVFMFK